MPRYAISSKSGRRGPSHQNIIEYNDIENANLETNDTGAIETLGVDKVHSGNIIRYNRIRNVVDLEAEGDSATPEGTFASWKAVGVGADANASPGFIFRLVHLVFDFSHGMFYRPTGS